MADGLGLAEELRSMGIDPSQYPLMTGSSGSGAVADRMLATQGLTSPTPISAGQPTSGGSLLSTIGKIGDVLTLTAQGMQGRGLTSAQLQAQQEMAAQARMQRFAQTWDVVSKFSQTVGGIEDRQVREQLLSEVEEPLRKAAGEYGNLVDLLRLPGGSNIPASLKEYAEHYPPLKARLRALDGLSPELREKGMQAILLDPNLLPDAQAHTFADTVGIPAIDALIEDARTQPGGQAALDKIQADGRITWEEFRNFVENWGTRGLKGTQTAFQNGEIYQNMFDAQQRYFSRYGIEQAGWQEAAGKARAVKEAELPYKGTPRNVLLPEGYEPRRQVYREVGGRFYQGGREVSLPPGSQIFGTAVTGTAEEALGLEKPVTTEIQKSLRENAGVLRGLRQLEGFYDPSFLTMAGRLRRAYLSAKDWVGILKPEEVPEQMRASAFMKSAFANMNSIIKQITGAQMSEPEAQRIKQQLANPEEGPVKFWTALQIQMSNIRMGIARDVLILQEGSLFNQRARQAGIDFTALTGKQRATIGALVETKDILQKIASDEVRERLATGIAIDAAREQVRRLMMETYAVDPMIDLRTNDVDIPPPF